MSAGQGRGGLLGHDLSGVPPEEVRCGVVLNGGVSLAVWMGGVALELDRLVKAPARGDEPYASLLHPASVGFLASLALAAAAALVLHAIGYAEEPLLVAIVLSVTSLGISIGRAIVGSFIL